MSKSRQTAAERYKAQGKIYFACWLDPQVVHTIKALAAIEDKAIPEVITERFGAVKMERSAGKVTVRFNKALEEA